MWQQPQFDTHQFRRRARAVDAHATADGFESTGIAHQDFGRMHITGAKKRLERRLPTPEWANSDDGIRKRVLELLERRLYLSIAAHLTDAERLQLIEAASKRSIPSLQAALYSIVNRYREDQRNTACPEETLRSERIQIQHFDSDIVMRRRGITALVISAVYKYYRLGWNSVQIANELNVKPPMIRIWLYRLNRMRDLRRRNWVSKAAWPAHRVEQIRL